MVCRLSGGHTAGQRGRGRAAAQKRGRCRGGSRRKICWAVRPSATAAAHQRRWIRPGGGGSAIGIATRVATAYSSTSAAACPNAVAFVRPHGRGSGDRCWGGGRCRGGGRRGRGRGSDIMAIGSSIGIANVVASLACASVCGFEFTPTFVRFDEARFPNFSAVICWLASCAYCFHAFSR